MLNFLSGKLKTYIDKGHVRSANAKRNILASFFIKGFSIAINLMLVPLTIHYVNPTRYGIWLTVSSIIGWVSFFDIGLGNGLRNKFAEALAKDQKELARIYLSTTYAILGIAISIVLLIFICINPFLNWARILNTPSEMASELSLLVGIVFVFFCLQFVLQLITTVITADQKPAKASFFNLLGSIFSLLIIFILTITTHGSLFYLGLALGITPVLVLLASSLWFYNHEYKYCAPSIKYVEFRYAKNLANIGLQFFVIQIAGLIVFSSNNIIIAQLLGNYDVTVYNIVYKYFAVILMIQGIILAPFWSAYTEAYVKNDFDWIRSITKRLLRITIILSMMVVFMVIFCNYIIKLWLNQPLKIPLELNFFFGLFTITSMFSGIYTSFINGTGKINLQRYLAIVVIFLNIPLLFFLIRYLHLGLTSIAISLFFWSFSTLIIWIIQFDQILNKNEIIYKGKINQSADSFLLSAKAMDTN